MTQEEYETAIGKLFLIKLYLTKRHADAVDTLIEALEAEYLDRKKNKQL